MRNFSTPFPHFSTYRKQGLKNYTADYQRFTFSCQFWHARCILLSERRNKQQSSRQTRVLLNKRTSSTKEINISTEENILIKTKLEGVAEKETKKLLTLKKLTNMKKVFFAAIAAIVMVSVSNAFASKNINANSDMVAIQADTTVTDSVAPAVEQPATEAPATEQPATEAPATEQPATEAPATEQPATEAPATEQPAAEAPATEAPAAE